MSARVRVVGGPWPERIGCVGVLVNPPTPTRYPFHGLGKNEVVVLLDADPLGIGSLTPDGRGWSCVMNRCHLEPAS